MLAVLLTCFWSDSTGCDRSLYYYLICMYDCNEDSALFTSVKKQWIYPMSLVIVSILTMCICGLVKVVFQFVPVKKKSSVLSFNMCFACVCFCVQPLCVNVIWYLQKRIFPFYVALAQKRPWSIACACTHRNTHTRTQMKNIAACTGMKLKGKLRCEEKPSTSPLGSPALVSTFSPQDVDEANLNFVTSLSSCVGAQYVSLSLRWLICVRTWV